MAAKRNVGKRREVTYAVVSFSTFQLKRQSLLRTVFEHIKILIVSPSKFYKPLYTIFSMQVTCTKKFLGW